MSEAILESQPTLRPKSITTTSTKTVAPGSSNGSLDFGKLVADHRAYFLSGATRSAEWRESQLRALRSMLKDHAEDFYAALWSDLRRNRIEADLVDVKCTTSEIEHVIAHFRRWMKPVPVTTPYQLAPSHGEVRFDPLGVGLIIGTWNYPVMLTLSPLVAAIAAGNCAVIKPSEVSPATGGMMARYLPEYLDRKAFPVVLGTVPQDDRAAGTTVGPHLFYRRHDSGQDRHDGGGKKPDAGRARTRRKDIRPSSIRQRI